MKGLSRWFDDVAGLSATTQHKVLQSVVVVGVLVLLHVVLVRIAKRRTSEVGMRYRWRKAITYVTVGTGFVVVGRIWFEGVGSLATYFGLLSAGLAIALKDLVANLAGWAFILWRRPFEVGDRVQIGDHAGE